MSTGQLVVGVDARVALLDSRGWGRYARELLAALASRSDLRIRALVPATASAELEYIGGNLEVQEVPFSRSSPDDYWRDSVAALPENHLGHVDLLHSLTRFVPPTQIRPVVATVHDVAPLSDPPFKEEYKDATLSALRILDGCGYYPVAVSEFTRWEMVHRGGMSRRDIPVIHEGASDGFSSSEGVDASQTASRWGLSGDYVIYVGGAGPNKNLATMLRAFATIRDNRAVQIALVGKRRWGYDRLLNGPLSHADGVVFCDQANDQDCAALYRGATALIMPSLHEGFGLPLVEAMAARTPVICSDIPVFREVCQDAACYFDPRSETSIAESVETVLRNEELRRSLVERGTRRVRHFSWDRVAKDTVHWYRAAIAEWTKARPSRKAHA